MQDKNEMSRNEARALATKTALMNAGKSLFVKQGYAETGTPEIVREAKVTRGALYHHFEGKAGLLRSIVARELAEISTEIRAHSTSLSTDARPIDYVEAGTAAYFAAMKDAGRQRLILRDGPAVLGPQEMARLDREAGAGGHADGLAALMGDNAPSTDVLAALSDILSAGFDRAVQTGAQDPHTEALRLIFEALAE